MVDLTESIMRSTHSIEATHCHKLQFAPHLERYLRKANASVLEKLVGSLMLRPIIPFHEVAETGCQ